MEILGGARSPAADRRPVPEDRGAAQAVGVAWHPAEVGGGGAGLLLGGGEGVAVGEGGAGQLLVGELATSSWGHSVHSGWEDNLNVKCVRNQIYERLNIKS